MKIKYSPCCSSKKKPTTIEVVAANVVKIDGEQYELDTSSVDWPAIADESGGAIQHAIRKDGELYLTILRRYAGGGRPEWDTGEYHEVDR